MSAVPDWLCEESNTAEQPTGVVPVTSQRVGIGPDFLRDFPAYSYTIPVLNDGAAPKWVACK